MHARPQPTQQLLDISADTVYTAGHETGRQMDEQIAAPYCRWRGIIKEH